MSPVDLSYDIKMVEDLVMKDQKLGVFADIDNPVRNEIRKKIRESKDRNKVKIQALNDLANRLRPLRRRERLECGKILSDSDVVFITSAVIDKKESSGPYSLRTRRTKVSNPVKIDNEKKPKKKFWYQREPFSDPVKEAKR